MHPSVAHDQDMRDSVDNSDNRVEELERTTYRTDACITYLELKAKLAEIKTAQPPFSAGGKVGVQTDDGTFWAEDLFLQPAEALRLGKWLVSFYEGAEE